MEFSFRDRLKHAWDVLTNKDLYQSRVNLGPSYSYRPDRTYRYRATEQSIVTAVYNRIALDVSQMKIQHVKVDDEGRYMETVDSRLNDCLTVEANIDQTSRDFIQDVVMSMFDEGTVAIMPTETNVKNILETGSFDIFSMRTAKVKEWYPRHVRLEVYDDRTGRHIEVIMPKDKVAIIQNPFYSVMNEPNSIVSRLNRKFRLLDIVDEYSSSGKLDLIIQLPYVVKSETRKNQAEERRALIEKQLANSKYGIAYIDGTEHITQLNRAVENNFLKQIEYLVNLFYSQLGITQEIMNGTASEEVMLNYNARVIEVVTTAIVDNMKRTFLTKTARSQGQSIMFFNDPFKLVSVKDLSELSDKLTRNEIASSNEIRQIVGMKPSKDPSADELRNKNLSQPKENTQPSATVKAEIPDESDSGADDTKKEE